MKGNKIAPIYVLTTNTNLIAHLYQSSLPSRPQKTRDKGRKILKILKFTRVAISQFRCQINSRPALGGKCEQKLSKLRELFDIALTFPPPSLPSSRFN